MTGRASVWVPGWGADGSEWEYSPIRAAFSRAGYDTAVFRVEPWDCDLHELGARLALHLARLPHERVVVVGHSMGGLVARCADLAGAHVDTVVTLGTPHHGAAVAYLLDGHSGRQMAPCSSFLDGINARGAEHTARYLAVSGWWDAVVPCAGWEWADTASVPAGHLDLPFSPLAADLAVSHAGGHTGVRAAA